MIKVHLTRTVFLSSLLVSSLGLVACSSGVQVEQAVHTGDPSFETTYGLLTDKQVQTNAQVYVAAQRLTIRNQPNIDESSIAGILDINDRLQVVDDKIIGDQKFIAVKVLKSQTKLDPNATYYVSMKYLSPTETKLSKENLEAQKIFVVSNIATEKTRVYRKCEVNEGCINKLLFEQDVVNGEDEDKRKTDVGHYRVTGWEKFYETPGVYPAWYKEGYPDVPAPKSSMSAWFNQSVMPDHQGTMRGAFGWYTAMVGPNPNGQWMHGTAGWGQDKQSFILFKNSFFGAIVNMFKAIRSHGCTRIDNESIAYLRSLVPVGATYVKIYAREASRNQIAEGSKQTGTWPYILTKNKGEVADREAVLKHGTPESQWIEQGVLTFKQTATAIPDGASNSDLYDIGSESFQGYFIVDEGTVLDYQHPTQLGIGGYSDHTLPNFMITNDHNIVIPTSKRVPSSPAGGMFPGH